MRSCLLLSEIEHHSQALLENAQLPPKEGTSYINFSFKICQWSNSQPERIFTWACADICAESGISETSSNTWLVCCIYFRTWSWEGNEFVPSPTHSQIWVKPQSRLGWQPFYEKENNSKLWRPQWKTILFFPIIHGNSQIIKKGSCGETLLPIFWMRMTLKETGVS